MHASMSWTLWQQSNIFHSILSKVNRMLSYTKPVLHELWNNLLTGVDMATTYPPFICFSSWSIFLTDVVTNDGWYSIGSGSITNILTYVIFTDSYCTISVIEVGLIYQEVIMRIKWGWRWTKMSRECADWFVLDMAFVKLIMTKNGRINVITAVSSHNVWFPHKHNNCNINSTCCSFYLDSLMHDFGWFWVQGSPERLTLTKLIENTNKKLNACVYSQFEWQENPYVYRFWSKVLELTRELRC